MKKLLLALIMSGLMSTTVFAAEATVAEIIQFKTGLTAAKLTFTGGNTSSALPLNGDSETQKKMLSILLTAQSTDAKLNVSACTEASVFGWCTISIK